MLKLEDIQNEQLIEGLEPTGPVKIIQVKRVSADSIIIYYERADNSLAHRQLLRSEEASLRLAAQKISWPFDAAATDFKLGAEALRIHLAHLFDPMMAVHTSDVDPLPHQIAAVYEEMLPRQPLRFVLADDPGAGKTIMAGLLIRELMIRGDIERCLVVAPGSLVEQWQTELSQKFGLRFDILSHQLAESTTSGNPFLEHNLLIARLDQLSRNERWQERLKADGAEWDLIIFDEAHKLSASFFGGERQATKRYNLAEMLGDPLRTRHLLLMTATPHNGKDEDFQLFMALVDRDRFGGRPQGDTVDASDLMRRMVKEDLLKFDGTKLFPERVATTITYKLSPAEDALYQAVTNYVRTEMGRADQLDKKRKGTVGFALTILQRRLASSPKAIHESLRRRRERLEKRLDELQAGKAKPDAAPLSVLPPAAQSFFDSAGPSDETLAWDEIEEGLSDADLEELEDTLSDQATTARTIPELQAELQSLRKLEAQARDVLSAGIDRKWEQLSKLLQDDDKLLTEDGRRRKLIIFTEHRDTLTYLEDKIGSVLDTPGAIVTIHGSTKREDRLNIQERFRQDPDVTVLIATDAAGEGVNLQNANLMVNYDLPWNPNRIEQRFGRIHRIGQTEVCHLWNLVAIDTREGDVFKRLFDKLETARKSLQGRVFDVLGNHRTFEEQSLRDMLIEAVRYGERPDVKAKLAARVDNALQVEHLKGIILSQALNERVMSPEQLFDIKQKMEEAEARKLQPSYLRAFLFQAFARLGGELREREPGRYEIRHVPAMIRKRHAIQGTRLPVLDKYERITFDRDRISILGKPRADLMHPGHPLMAAVIDLTRERVSEAMQRGTVLIDPRDPGTTPRVLFLLDHSIREGTRANRLASQRIHMVEIDADGKASYPGVAPYLNYEEPAAEDRPLIEQVLSQPWLQEDLSNMALVFATEHLVPDHLAEVKGRRESLIAKTLQAVHERLVKEINYWASQVPKLQSQVDAGKQPKMQPVNARRRAEELTARLEVRTRELEDQRHLSSNPPVLRGIALIVPQGLADQFHGRPPTWSDDPAARKAVEMKAMAAVMAAEATLGNRTSDVSERKCGWDITSITERGESRHIEVKGRRKDADIITVTHNEVLMALNQGDKYILAIVLVAEDGSVEGPHYVRKPFTREPDAWTVSVNCDLKKLLAQARPPAEV